MPKAKPPVFYSKVSVKSQTVLPREVRDKLLICPGDRIRYRIDDKGVYMEKSGPLIEDVPFTAFSEWASVEEDEVFADL